MVASDDDDAFLSQFQQLLRRLNERPDDRPGTLTPLGERLQDSIVTDPRTILTVRATSNADYQRVVTAMVEARDSGIVNIGIQP